MLQSIQKFILNTSTRQLFHTAREYIMIYRGQGYVAGGRMIRLLPPLPPSPGSKLCLRHTKTERQVDEGRRGVGCGKVQKQQENLVL
jgi:hypothetical protein